MNMLLQYGPNAIFVAILLCLLVKFVRIARRQRLERKIRAGYRRERLETIARLRPKGWPDGRVP